MKTFLDGLSTTDMHDNSGEASRHSEAAIVFAVDP